MASHRFFDRIIINTTVTATTITRIYNCLKTMTDADPVGDTDENLFRQSEAAPCATACIVQCCSDLSLQISKRYRLLTGPTTVNFMKVK
jgi:hypothetical protein